MPDIKRISAITCESTTIAMQSIASLEMIPGVNINFVSGLDIISIVINNGGQVHIS